MSTITFTSKTYRQRNESTIVICPKCSLNMVVDDLYNKKGNSHHGTIGYCVNGCVHDDASPYYLFVQDVEELIKVVAKIKEDVSGNS